MEKIKKCKVYKITSPSGRIYVGSTTQSIEERWKHYKSLDCKSQTKIYNSLKKYGPENHIFEVIWEGVLEDMFKMERIFGDMFNVLDMKKGLTCQLPGYDDIPPKTSEETKKRLSESGKKRPKISEETRGKLSETSRGRIMPERTDEYKKNVSEKHKGKSSELSAKCLIKARLKLQRPVDMFDLNWNYVMSFDSMETAAKHLNRHNSNIRVSAKSDGLKTCCKHRFKYKETPLHDDSVFQIDNKTGEILYKWGSIKEVLENVKVSRENLVIVLGGTGYTAGGFKWKYANEEYDKIFGPDRKKVTDTN